MRLVGLTEFKMRAGLAAPDDDAMIGALLDSVSARIEQACNRSLTKANYTEKCKPVGNAIAVMAYPIDPGQPITLTDYNFVVPSSDYDVDYESGVVTLLWRTFTYDHFRSVTISYTGGYAEKGTGSDKALAVPDDLKDACAKQVKFEYQNRDTFGQQSVSMDGASVALAEPKFLKFVEDVIRRRSRMFLG